MHDHMTDLYGILYAAAQHEDAALALDAMARGLRIARQRQGWIEGHPLDRLASRMENIAMQTCAARRQAIERARAEGYDRDPHTVDWIDGVPDVERS